MPDRAAASHTRFFIALLPPEPIQTEATALKVSFRDRYHSQAALKSPPHITLQPPFEWPRDRHPELITAISHFRTTYPQIPIELSGFGAFPPRVIYINVVQTPALMGLQVELSKYLAETLGMRHLRSRDRAFHPHLTLAFHDLKPAAFRQAWPEFEPRPYAATFTATALTLLIHTGQVWQMHQIFPFAD